MEVINTALKLYSNVTSPKLISAMLLSVQHMPTLPLSINILTCCALNTLPDHHLVDFEFLPEKRFVKSSERFKNEGYNYEHYSH